ncbi:hypothetical protein WJX84_005459, partial [Apatococcus fuscideae]
MEANRLDLSTPSPSQPPTDGPETTPAAFVESEGPSTASTSRPATEDTARLADASTSETQAGDWSARSPLSSRPPLSGGARNSTGARFSVSGAAPETARSRLSSARRAAQIEGFDDDFADEVGPSEEDVSETARRRLEELEAAEQADLTERLKTAEERNRALKLQNASIQQGLRQLLDARMALDERKRQAQNVQQSLRKFLLDITRNALQSKTGRPLPPKMVDAMEKAQDAKLDELQRVRQLNLFLRSRMTSLDERLKRKEEMAEGLHLIDFEQLKIENQSLAEKIEERNEELARLRGKTSQVMQILAHIKEKLHAVTKDNKLLQAQLDGHEQELNSKRVQLKAAKSAADRSLAQEQKLRESNPYVTAASLLNDLEKSRGQHNMLSAQ